MRAVRLPARAATEAAAVAGDRPLAKNGPWQKKVWVVQAAECRLGFCITKTSQRLHPSPLFKMGKRKLGALEKVEADLYVSTIRPLSQPLMLCRANLQHKIRRDPPYESSNPWRNPTDRAQILQR